MSSTFYLVANRLWVVAFAVVLVIILSEGVPFEKESIETMVDSPDADRLYVRIGNFPSNWTSKSQPYVVRYICSLKCRDMCNFSNGQTGWCHRESLKCICANITLT
ncbi:hypothetical protein CHUAL_007625 [Chamberlinius hualienensis]